MREALAYIELTGADADDIASICADEGDMQVRLEPDGDWHREAVGRAATACGERLKPAPAMGWGGVAVRKDEYSGKPCPHCFTRYELLIWEQLARVPDNSNTNTGEDR